MINHAMKNEMFSIPLPFKFICNTCLRNVLPKDRLKCIPKCLHVARSLQVFVGTRRFSWTNSNQKVSYEFDYFSKDMLWMLYFNTDVENALPLIWTWGMLRSYFTVFNSRFIIGTDPFTFISASQLKVNLWNYWNNCHLKPNFGNIIVVAFINNTP